MVMGHGSYLEVGKVRKGFFLQLAHTSRGSQRLRLTMFKNSWSFEFLESAIIYVLFFFTSCCVMPPFLLFAKGFLA